MTKNNFTLTLIKPYAVEHGYVGHILARINEAGFRISAMKYTQLSREQAEAFYEVHRNEGFFGRLIEFMTKGPLVVALLEKENAVGSYRRLIGATDPDKAEDGTLRKLFGASVELNAVHGSDSDENARREAAFFFSRLEIF